MIQREMTRGHQVGRILSLDVGSKRVGVALTDESRVIASPQGVFGFANWKAELKKIIEENEIELIVVGLPRRMDGSIGEKAEEATQFGQKLEDEFKIKVEYEDETATSIEAEERLRERGVNVRENKEEIDMESAVIILESYLNRKNDK